MENKAKTIDKEIEKYREFAKSRPDLFNVVAAQAKLLNELCKKQRPVEVAARLLIRLLRRQNQQRKHLPDGIGPFGINIYHLNLFIDAMAINSEERAATKEYAKMVFGFILHNKGRRKMTDNANKKLDINELKRIVQETVYEEISFVAESQKTLSEDLGVYLEKVHFLKEFKELKSVKTLKEFFGPFKKLGVSDLERMADKGGGKRIADKVKVAEGARKKLMGISLANVPAVENALESYVATLVDLYSELKSDQVSVDLKKQALRIFGVAAFTIQSLQSALAKAASELFTKVPRSSGMFRGTDPADMAARKGAFMRSPAQALGAAAKDVVSGAGGPPPGASGRMSGAWRNEE